MSKEKKKNETNQEVDIKHIKDITLYHLRIMMANGFCVDEELYQWACDKK